jgi:hypothetical protein
MISQKAKRAAYFKKRNYWAKVNESVKVRRARPEVADARERAASWVRLMQVSTACQVCGRKARVRVDGTLHHAVDWYPKDGSPRRLNTLVREGASVGALEVEMDSCDAYCITCWRRIGGAK